MGSFSLLDIIIFTIYLISILFIGLFFSKGNMKDKEFLKGDGKIPWYVSSLSIFATLISPLSFIGIAGNAFYKSWYLMFAQFGMLIAIPLVIIYVLPLYQRLNLDTAYDYLERRFDSKFLRVCASFLFIFFQFGRISIIMYLPSFGISAVTGININLLIFIMGFIALIYSYTGGLKSVLWTDFTQALILIVGVLSTLLILLYKIDGSFVSVFEALKNGKFLDSQDKIFHTDILKGSLILLFIGNAFNLFMTYSSSQDLVQRFTTTNDINKLRKMMVTNGILAFLTVTIFYLIGTSLFVYYQVQNPGVLPEGLKPDQILIYFVSHNLPIGMRGLIIATIYAAAQSTISTGLNSVAASYTLDIQNTIGHVKDSTKTAKFVSLVTGILSIFAAIYLANRDIRSAYELSKAFTNIVIGVMGGLFILGFVSKKADEKSALLAFFTSLVIISYLTFKVPDEVVSYWSYSIISCVVSLAVGVGSSLLFNFKVKNKNEYTIRNKE